MTTVEVKNLSFNYNGGPPLLRDISFSITKGEVFVIAGASGSGKTTLCRILCGIIPHAFKGDLTGGISVIDIDPSSVSLPQASLRAGMVFQDADSQIICSTVEDELAFGPENFCNPREDIRRRVDELLLEFGFDELRYTNPSHLSDGQKKLLTIAAVLSTSPPVLILDEPMSGLDFESRDLVSAIIEKQKRQDRTVIIVEHDLETVTTADKWLLLDNGTIAACDRPSEIMKDENKLRDLGVWA